MGFLKADTGGYHRLLASAGMILLALALIAPWLVMREMGPLTIEQAKLDALTPQARSVLLDRQDRLQFLQDWMPIWVTALLLLGAFLVFFGARGMKEVQPYEVREMKARAQKAEASIGTQSPSDRQQKALEEAVEEVAVAETSVGGGVMTGESGVQGTDGGDPPNTLTEGRREAINRAGETAKERAARRREALSRVLARLAQIPWHAWDFQSEVKVSSGSSRPVLADALLQARHPAYSDWVIEVVEHSKVSYMVARHVADRLLAAVARYQSHTGRRAKPWLIVLFDGEQDPSKIEDTYMRQLSMGAVSAIPSDDLDGLEQAARVLN